MLLERVVGQAGDERVRLLHEPAAVRPAQVGAAVVARERDHAAGVERACLRRDRDRLELSGVAVAGVDQCAQRVRGIDFLVVDEADLRLVDVLPRVELQRRRIDAARVGIELRARQAERVLRARQVQAVRDDGERAAQVVRDRELGVADGALGRAVVAVAVGAEVARGDDVAQAVHRAARFCAEAHDAVAAAGDAEVERRPRRGVFGEDLDHAARRVAVERREGTAQHLDAIGRAEVDVRDLALAVGEGRRNAVDVEAHAADAEGRARAEAAHRDLHVLRVVLAVAREQARDAAEALGDVDLRAALADRLGADAVDRGGDVEGRGLGARRRDDDRRERRAGGRRRRRDLRERMHREQRQGDRDGSSPRRRRRMRHREMRHRGVSRHGSPTRARSGPIAWCPAPSASPARARSRRWARGRA